MSLVWFSKRTAILFLNDTDRMLFATEIQYIFKTGAKILNTILLLLRSALHAHVMGH